MAIDVNSDTFNCLRRLRKLYARAARIFWKISDAHPASFALFMLGVIGGRTRRVSGQESFEGVPARKRFIPECVCRLQILILEKSDGAYILFGHGLY